ncbi:MAG TPA: SDR family oxidoreductase [Spirochaetota bacterium]|nr:SDR family oxidoreductase [Spirochaetota bacterium]HNT12607.1 SDR family oxidoreductase [Spirochaetota bacterium]HOS39181.1 SDR family oxidoreductase [Spirochaetota bacterium]
MGSIAYNLADRVAVITGGSRGIGREIARSFLAEGARVVICGRKQDGLDGAAADLGGGDRLLTVPAHIAKEADVAALFEHTLQRFGRVDVLVNNVGMNLMTGSLVDVDLVQWQKIIESNLTGTFLCSRAAGKIMRDQRKGKIVSLSSIAGRKASPAMNIYGIAKAGIEMMTRNLAAELAPFNVQVNAVAPGMVRTDFSKPFWSSPELYDHIVKAVPMGRIAEVRDVVHPVLFLCSEGSDFITGQTIMVDGGATAV